MRSLPRRGPNRHFRAGAAVRSYAVGGCLLTGAGLPARGSLWIASVQRRRLWAAMCRVLMGMSKSEPIGGNRDTFFQRPERRRYDP
jgi:hypothetical protein